MLGADPHGPAVGEHDLVGNIEAEAQVPRRRTLVLIGAAKGFEDRGQHIGRNRITLIRHLNEGDVAFAGDVDHDRRLGPSVLDGVADDVGQRFGQAVGVPDPGQVPLDLQVDGFFDIAAATMPTHVIHGDSFELPQHRDADIAQVHAPGLEGKAAAQTRPGEVQQLGNHARHALTAGDNAIKHGLAVAVQAATEQVGAEANRGQGVSQVVADDADEQFPKPADDLQLALAVFGLLGGQARPIRPLVGQDGGRHHLLIGFAAVVDGHPRNLEELGPLDGESRHVGKRLGKPHIR